MYIDSHCHLDFDAFDGDRELVLSRAQEAGVQGLINPGIDLENSRQIIALAAAHPVVFAAVGVHPNSALTWNTDTQNGLVDLTRSEKVLAIGEIGLDYYRDWAPRPLQRDILERQLNLAAEAVLPVIVHVRNTSPADNQAVKDTLDILSTWQAGLAASGSILADRPGVLHSYSGDTASALQAIEIGFFIGITGPVTFRNASELQRTITELPLDHLLIETDAPFLTPHPHRGKRNEPAYVGLVADKIAVLQQIEPERVAEVTTSNAVRLFNWRVNH